MWIDDYRFIEYKVPTAAIATSNGQNDSGMFELNFRDDRRLPFEGGGAISHWSLEMMRDKNLRQFDYKTITDVILTLRYTAREDAGLYKTKATEHLQKLFDVTSLMTMTRFFDLKHDFPSAWHQFWHPTAEGTINELKLNIGKELFPFIAVARDIRIDAIKFFAKMKEESKYWVSIFDKEGTEVAEVPDIELVKTQNSGELREGGNFGTGWLLSNDSPLEKSIKISKGTMENYLETKGEKIEDMYMVLMYRLI